MRVILIDSLLASFREITRHWTSGGMDLQRAACSWQLKKRDFLRVEWCLAARNLQLLFSPPPSRLSFARSV